MVTEMDEWPRWTWTALGLAPTAMSRLAEVVYPESLRETGLLDGRVPGLRRKLLLRSGAPCGEVKTMATG
jgi:hypothetical protein